MAVQKISYANKQYGDLWTSQEANDVKSVVNNNADELSGVKDNLQTISGTLDAVAQTNAQNAQMLQILVADNVRQVFLTQAQYDALIANETVESDVLYNIYE